MQVGFSYTEVLPPLRVRLKLIIFAPVYLENKLYSNVNGALKFTQNDIINF